MFSIAYKPVLIIGVSLAVVLGAAQADSHSTGNEVVDARMAAMKVLGKNMKAIGGVAKGKVAYSDSLNANAAELNEAAKTIAGLFSEKVMIEQDRAKPEIWMTMGDFKMKADALTNATEGLKVAVATGDQGKIGAAIGAAGKTCGGCHKAYRKPKKE